MYATFGFVITESKLKRQSCSLDKGNVIEFYVLIDAIDHDGAGVTHFDQLLQVAGTKSITFSSRAFSESKLAASLTAFSAHSSFRLWSLAASTM